MISRIHLAIEYLPPALNMRRLIWVQYLAKIAPCESAINLTSDVDTLVQDRLNGREISNALNTARTLARYEKEKLQLHHIETVLSVRRNFNTSVMKMKTTNASGTYKGSGSERKNSILMSSDVASEWLP